MALGLQAANLLPVAVLNPKGKVKSWGLGGSVGPGIGQQELPLDKALPHQGSSHSLGATELGEQTPPGMR